jgi:HSP20 family protein
MMRDLIPWGRGRSVEPYREEGSPLLSLHREMNRLFDEAFRGFGSPSLFGRGGGWPSLELAETDKAVTVSAEIPGLDEKDVEVTFSDGVLTLRGEKKSEVEDKQRHFSERSYGRFERQVAVGREIDEDKIEASFKNGVLTITLPKTERAQSRARRIAINGDGTKKAA